MARVDITRRSDGRRTTGSRSRYVPELERYNGPDRTARGESRSSDRDRKGVI